MKKKLLTAALGLLIILSFKLLVTAKDVICPGCNIILIAVETLRSDHLPCYGYAKNTAPNICKLAENAVVFDNHYTQEPYTLPAYASLFTSLYSVQHGMRYIIKDDLAPGILTMAQILKKDGYTNYWSAPMYDDNLPLGKGLDSGFDIYNDVVKRDPFTSWEKSLDEVSGKSFLFLHTFKIHEPYIPANPGTIGLFTDKIPEGVPTTFEEMEGKFRVRVMENISRLALFVDAKTKNEYPEAFADVLKHKEEVIEILLTDWKSGRFENKALASELLEIFREAWQENLSEDPERVEFIKSLYDAQIFETDEAVGKILKVIKDKGLMEKSVIIIYSPMGEQFNEHSTGFSHSKDLYQSSIKTPLIIRYPGNKPHRVTVAVESIDILPTLLQIVGIKIPEQAEGISFARLLAGKKDSRFNNRPVVSMLGGGDRGITLIKDDGWKLILNPGKGNPSKELYNILVDPEEKENLVDVNVSIAGNTETAINNFIPDLRIYKSGDTEFPEWMDEDKRERLKNTGYF